MRQDRYRTETQHVRQNRRVWAAMVVFLLVLFGTNVRAQVKMPDMITPGDTWGLIDVNVLYGGCMQYDSYAALLNTDVQFLKRGMLFVVYDYDGNNANGLDTRVYMFLPASGNWSYNTPFEIPAADQGRTISSAGLESALSQLSMGLSSSASEGDVSYNQTDSKFYVFNGTQWVEIPMDNTPGSGGTNPATAKGGDIFYNTTEKKLYVFDGTKWVEIPTDSAPGSGGTNPVTAQAGDVFYNTTEKKLYVYDGTKWVEIPTESAPGSGGTNPVTAQTGDVFYNTTEKKLYVYDGTKWVEIPIDSAPGSGGTNPVTAQPGDVFYNTTEKKLYVYDGAGWIEIQVDDKSGAGATNPPGGEVGDVFYNTTDNKLYVYNGTTWVSVSGDNLGNHTATAALKMGEYPINKDGASGKGLLFDINGNAIFENDVTINGNLYTPSDERLKTHIETLTGVLEKIDGLRGVRFEYVNQKKYVAGEKIGVIAQELRQIYPSMVMQGEDGFLKVDYTQLTAVLIQAVKEQQQQINELKAGMGKLQEQINEIRKKME